MASVAHPAVPQPDQQRQQQEERERGEKRVTRARLVQRLVESAGNLPDFMDALVHTQAVVVAGTEAAAFLLEGQGPDGKPELRTVAHVRPDNVEESVKRQALMAFREIVTQCLGSDKDGALRISDSGPGNDSEPQFCLVTILRQNDRPVAASAVITRCRDENRALQRLSTMQLVAGYFELFLLRRDHEKSSEAARTHQDVFQFASTVATGEDFQAAATGLCNELAARAGAARVAVGWVKGLRNDRVKLVALSHTEEFDKKQELSVQLVAVMEECLDQDEFIQFDPAGASTENVTRQAMMLSQREGGNRVVSVPLRRRDEVVGVLTLEFPPEKAATPQEATALAVAAELLAPQLYDRYQNDRYLITKTGLSVRDNTKKLFGLRQHTLAKVLVAAAIGLVLFLLLFKPMYQISAPFEFVAEKQRVVDVPYDGRIEDVSVDVGDVVKKGDEIARLNTEDLELQLLEELNAAAEARAEATLARTDRPNQPASEVAARLADLQAETAESRAARLRAEIAKSTILAPIEGVVLEVPGQTDLRERIGSVVRVGDPLVIIGDDSSLLAELKVADRDIEDVQKGDVGTLATAAVPGDKVPFRVVKVIPSAAADPASGRNAFTVVAVVDAAEADQRHWKVNASGEARIDVAPKSLAWQWTHRLGDWIKLKLWL